MSSVCYILCSLRFVLEHWLLTKYKSKSSETALSTEHTEVIDGKAWWSRSKSATVGCAREGNDQSWIAAQFKGEWGRYHCALLLVRRWTYKINQDWCALGLKIHCLISAVQVLKRILRKATASLSKMRLKRLLLFAYQQQFLSAFGIAAS